MDTDCNSEYEDGSPDVSVGDEEEEEAPAERLTSSSLKRLNQNEDVNSKLSDAMDANQSEDSGLTWETSSSRCSTSQASETSATSGVYSTENSCVDCPSGKSKHLMDEGKNAQKRSSNSSDQAPMYPNRIVGSDDKKYDFPEGSININTQERELDPADPQSWPSQVQPSKIKDYLVHITQEVVLFGPEEKDNALMRKGELPLKGTVRARIQQITAVLEERNKKIFRRINQKDVPPPSDVIRKPREQPKIFPRPSISVSLRHVERDAPDKKNKKEIISHNLRHVETKSSKAGVSVPYNKDEKRARRSFLPEKVNNSTQKLPPISLRSSNQDKKLDTKIQSPVKQTSIPEQASIAPSDWQEKTEKRSKPTLPPGTPAVTTEKLSSHLAETEEQKIQDHSPLTSKVSDTAEESKAFLKQEAAQLHPTIPTECLSYSENDANNQSDLIATIPSEPAIKVTPYPNSIGDIQPKQEQPVSLDVGKQDAELTIPTQIEIKNAALSHPTEDAGKQDIPLYSLETSGSVPELAELLPSISRAKNEELEVGYSKTEEAQEQLAMPLQADSKPPCSPHLAKESDAGETETVPDLAPTTSRREMQEESRYKTSEEHSGLPQPLYFSDEKTEQKEEEHLGSDLTEQAAPAQISVAISLEPERPDVSLSKGSVEKQPALLEASKLLLPTPDAHREEIHQLSATVARSENELPIISEPIKAPQESEPLELSHIRGKEVRPGSPVEALSSTEQLPCISSHLTENEEKQESLPSPLVIARPLLEQQDSVLPCPPDQREKQNNLPSASEAVAEEPEASSQPLLDVQNAEIAKAEIQPVSPTEEMAYLSRESDVVIDKEATQLISPLSTEPLSESFVPSQEEEKLKDQFHPGINEKQSLVDKSESHPTISEGEQEGQFHLPALIPSQLDHLVKSESRKLSMEQNSSVSPQLVETIPLSLAHEQEKKDIHPDKPITEPLHTDSEQAVSALEKQEKQQDEAEKTIQQLSHTVLTKESDLLQSIEKAEINDTSTYLSVTAQDLSQSAYLMETQEDQCVTTDATALSIPYNKAEAEKYDRAEAESKHTVKEAIQISAAKVETDYSGPESEGELEAEFPEPGSGEHLNVSFSSPSIREDLQSHRSVIPGLEEEQPVSLERESEDPERNSLKTPVSPEALESQNYPCDILNKAPKISPIISQLVSDKRKDQEIPTKAIGSLASFTEQSNFTSQDLKDKEEKNDFHQFPEAQQTVPEETQSLRIVPHGESREEIPNSVTTPETELEMPSSILEDVVSKKVNEMPPPELSYAVAERRKKDHLASFLNKSKQMATEKPDVQDAQPHLFLTGQSEMSNQDNKPYPPVASELEDLSLINSIEEVKKQETPPSLPSVELSSPINQELWYHKEENQESIILETEQSREHDAPLKLSILQQENLKQISSVPPFLTKKVEEQEISSQTLAPSVSPALRQSVPLDLNEEDKQKGIEPYPTEEVNGIPEEPLSLAAFLLSEANAVHTSFPHTTEKENLDMKPPSEEAGLLTEKSGKAVALPDTNITAKREPETSKIHFESEFLSEKPQDDVTNRSCFQEKLEDNSDIQTYPSFIPNEISSVAISEAMDDTNVHKPRSTVGSELPTNSAVSKSIGVSGEDISKAEEKCLLNSKGMLREPKNVSEGTLKEPENYLEKTKESKDHRKVREGSILAPELDQGKDTFDIFESYEVENIHALTDKEDTCVLKSLQRSGTVSSLKTKLWNNSEDTAIDHEPSISGKALEAGKQENRRNESKEHVEQKCVNESTEAKGEISILPESRGDDILKNIDMEYVDNLIDDTSFSQTGKEKSIKEAQRPSDVKKTKMEEAKSITESSEKIVNLSLLERNLDEVSSEIEKKGNVMATHENTLKLPDENKEMDVVTETNKDIEGGLNLVEAGVPLFNSEKDISSQSPLASLPVSAASPEPPALAFLYRDLHEEVMQANKEDSICLASEEIGSTGVSFPATTHALYDGTEIFLKKDIPEDDIPNNLEESQKEEVLKDQPINEPAINQSNILENAHEINKEQNEFGHILTEPYDQTVVVEPREMVENMIDKLTKGPEEIMSNIKVGICHPTLAIPFGSRLYGSGASNDDEDSQKEESIPEERGEMLPEETSDEESSPILDYAATVYQNEATVQHEPKDTCFAVGQNQQPTEKPIQQTDNGDFKEPVEISQQSLEAFCNVNTPWQFEGEQAQDNLISAHEPVSQDRIAVEHEHLSDWDTERQAFGESINDDLYEDDTEIADLLSTDARAEKSFGEMDYSLLSHDFDTYPLYSIKEEEYSDIEEDLAELMDYEMVTHDEVFQEEASSEVACEELLFDDRKALDRISNTYEFVNEGEISTYAEDEFELMDPDRLPRNVPEIEVLQKEIDEAQFDTYCHQCKCPISADDKLSEEHKEHDMTDLDIAVTVLKGQLDRYLDVLQERSLKIEGFVSEIEALFNSIEENCKEKEQLLEEQNENIVKTVVGHHDRTAQSFEDVKKTKMEYLYEKMVNFQEYIDTAKETLEAIIKEAEEMDDFTFLTSSEEINKRLLSAVENILTLEKMPGSFSQFKHYACGTGNGDQTLKHISVPQTPKLQPQDPNSATSTSITVYWTVNEEDVIDFFQVYCMEEYPGSKEQSGLVEEYRVVVKESNCILEDLEPGHSYSVWVMAVNYTGCSFPSDKSTFRTAPRIPVIKAEECTICWNTATIRWSSSNPEATDSFTLEYCRQYSPEGEGLRSLAGIKRPEMKVHLESNVNYFFYVRAVNVFGTSDQSEAALISTKGTRFHIMKETAHPTLQVSPNGTMICLPEDTELPISSSVLGELLPAQGWHYWETTVDGCAAFKVGICYSSPAHDSILGQDNASWCLYHSSKESFVYKVLHNGEMSNIIVTEQPTRIGILLDYNAGRLLFFNAERGQVLSAIRHKFNHPAHPAFVLEHPGVLNLHTGMELPEFVK